MDDCEESPCKSKPAYFVKPHVRAGILPEMLTDLIKQRKVAKGDMGQSEKAIERLSEELKVFKSVMEITDDIEKARRIFESREKLMSLPLHIIPNSADANFIMKYATFSDWHQDTVNFAPTLNHSKFILQKLIESRFNELDEQERVRSIADGRQLALKISANSIYGFTGASVGKLPCLEIAACVTAWGRDMILLTKQYAEEYFTRENGFDVRAGPNKDRVVVVYGDTDSVMIDTGLPMSEIEKAIAFGRLAADLATENIHKKHKLIQKGIVKLEWEKVFCPYIIIEKKRYCGKKWLKAAAPEPKLDIKGLEPARRDNCLFSTKTLMGSLVKLMDTNSAVEGGKVISKAVSDLYNDRVDVSQLVITKTFSKEAEDYKGKQPHVELVQRMRERDYGSAPVLGDRVPYVMVRRGAGTKMVASECAEDPIYAIENNLPIDYDYYIEKQLLKPVKRIFGVIMNRPEDLIYGDASRQKRKKTKGQYGIKEFTQEIASCIVCKAMLDDKNSSPYSSTLCIHCEPRQAEIYQLLNQRRVLYEKRYKELWTNCQRCQSDLHKEIICSNKDCPQFFARAKARKDLADVEDTIQNLSNCNDW